MSFEQSLFEPNISFIPVTVNENSLEEGALELLSVLRPAWEPSSISYKLYTDGITNKLLGCVHKGIFSVETVVIIRVYGNKTDLMIDRNTELITMKTLYNSGFAPKLLASFNNGLAMEFVPGVTLNTESVKDHKVWPLIARTMAKMHKVDVSKHPEIAKKAALWDKIEIFFSLIPEPFTDTDKQKRFTEAFGTLTELRIEYNQLKSYLSDVDSPLVFAHNDLLLGNVIYNETEERVTFIDFEYSANNYQAFDIANHFAEYVGITDIDYSRYPCELHRLAWLRVYLEQYLSREPSPAEVARLGGAVARFLLAAHFLWCVWSLVQADLSYIDFDFIDFAIIRFNEYVRVRNTLRDYSRV